MVNRRNQSQMPPVQQMFDKTYFSYKMFLLDDFPLKQGV